MKYEIVFVYKEFKELMNDSILSELMEMKSDDFTKKQFSYFFYNAPIDSLKENLKKTLFDREDIIFDDELVIYKNQITHDSARLIFDKDKIFISCSNINNPILNAINNSYDTILHLANEN